MTPIPVPSHARTLAAMTSALVQPYDITDVLADMLQQVTTALGAKATGVLVLKGGGELELLSSTSHAMDELEIYQTQITEGPCIDALHRVGAVRVSGEKALCARWPSVGPAMVTRGYLAVHAEPLRWQGRALGGLNVFFADPAGLDDDGRALVQAFADIITLALVQTQAPSDRELTAHIEHALEARTLIEHGKGVLMHNQRLGPEDAYAALIARARQQGLTVSEMARNLIWQAHTS